MDSRWRHGEFRVKVLDILLLRLWMDLRVGYDSLIILLGKGDVTSRHSIVDDIRNLILCRSLSTDLVFVEGQGVDRQNTKECRLPRYP